ncbi:CRISPR system precrRNA processing endoribonuclease RAMP protein Cas6 [Acidianus sulfidivorans JP7]|uniref:CRISPR-associated protein Cas6 n=1 Tax=Acidianus sulfidivorans JP7 TaxID=619593 RepID=A0A2U9IQ51_9CREN|nr:CRISPR system precrRNA processing endoribonuclease RAMP protein Cas6 [Acidianus sulfidivorans]AWR98123.1 CRISPR system precrRNA processing endoribonuclease RAMP protein Cas6 [Acidianus sulfidivorans JP7]
MINVYQLYKLKIAVSPFRTTDYTGKFIKTLLMNANPAFKEVFENPSYPTPKPIRVTPLLKGEEKFPTQAIYPKAFKRGDDSSPPSLNIGGEYYFLVGIRSDLQKDFMQALGNLFLGVKLHYGNFDVFVKVIGYEQIDVNYHMDYQYLYVKFISPAIFSDPFSRIAGVKRDKIKRFAPIPPIIFSTNVYELLKERYSKTIIRLAYAFYESHINLETVKRIWYYYDGKWLPGVIGYAKFIRKEKVRREALEDFVKILTHAQIMGVGTSRANGFGYVIIDVK